MAVDTPAKIAILGAGPIGLEAALYARYLGYEVELFERGTRPAAEVYNHRFQPMLTPFGTNRSSLGLAALKAQDENYAPPADDAFITQGEWHAAYLQPLAESDLIADCLKTNINEIRVGKVEIAKTDRPTGEFDRGCWDFRLLIDQAEVGQRVIMADIVFDCSGVNQPLFFGHGGLPAMGETALSKNASKRLQYHPQRVELLTGNICVVGDDLSAAESIIALADAAKHNPKLSITWVTRHAADIRPLGPLEFDEHDPLPARAKLIQTANELARSERVTWWPETWIEAIREVDEKLQVTFSGSREETHTFDHLLNHNGCVPAHHMTRELALDICPHCEAPRPFAESLLARNSSLQIEYPASSPEALITSEPNFYILGSKSFGRLPGFLLQHGLRQIRDVFKIIGDRADLDLYAKYAGK